MKYQDETTKLKELLDKSKNILILLPFASSFDDLASALSIYLFLSQSGKSVQIVKDGALKIDSSQLYGVGEVKSILQKTGSSKMVLTLENVVDENGLISSLEKLDWFPDGKNLNLVFHIATGRTFEPTKIEHRYEGSKLDLLIAVGASNTRELGNIYSRDANELSQVLSVNIDRDGNNAKFGTINIVDSSVSSISEILTSLLPGLGINIDADIASNLLGGLYSATKNLTVGVTPDTFIAASLALRAGGKLPQAFQRRQEEVQKVDQNRILQPQPQQPQQPEATPTPDWLVPKVFKGGSLG